MRKLYSLLSALIISASATLSAQPGTLDQTFGNKGMSVSDSAKFSMYPRVALQTDGKIVVATNAFYNDRGFLVIRYNRNGSRDSSFGVNGVAAKAINPDYESSNAVAIQPDGKIIVGGSTSYNNGSQSQFVLIRFTSGGKIDSSFANNGVHVLPIYNASDAKCTLTKIIIKPDGKILAGGHAANSFGISYFGYEQLKQNGSLDSSFGVNGSFLTPVYWDIDFNTAIDSTKRIIAGGEVRRYNNFGMQRYNYDGSVDHSFGYGGISDTIPDFRSRDMLVEPDGKIVFFGQSLIDNDYLMTVLRFDSSGKLDRTFGDTGVVYKSFNGLGYNANALLRQPDGKYIIVGWSGPTFMIRYNHDGSIDSSFGKGGMVNTTFPGGQLINGGAALQEDGKIVLAGTARYIYDGNYLILTRYERNAPLTYNLINGNIFLDKNSNGIRDINEPDFTNAKIVTNKPGYDTITTMAAGHSFEVYPDTGSYTTTVLPYQPYYTAHPASHITNFSTYYNTDSVVFAMQPIRGKRDEAIQVIPLSIARPGFPNKYVLYYKNQGTDTATGIIEMIKSSKLDFNTSVPAPTYRSGDTLRWSFSNLMPLDTASILLSLSVKAPPVVTAGDTLSSVATISSNLSDLTPADNRSTIVQLVRGSYDPNDKTEAHGGKIKTTEISSGDYLYYTIRFQNTGSDTAFNIYIRDTLSDKLDWTSFEMVAASSNYQVTFNEGKCLFTLSNIKLVDSNTNEQMSHGYLVYRIKPKANAGAGEVILNQASIYFDYNLPIFTNNEMTTIVANALPLKLLSFTAKKDGRINLLQWNTSAEVNVERFEVERSSNGSRFNSIGFVDAGNVSYQFKDEQPIGGMNYYRLKIKDKDGGYIYSPIRVLNNSSSFLLRLYPNPAKEDLQLLINTERKSTLQLQVLSIDGKLLLASKIEVEGVSLKSIDIRRLKSGEAYYLKASSENDERVIKFEKM